jgi:CubicO group peptidase (beta-lactamase class C family)
MRFQKRCVGSVVVVLIGLVCCVALRSAAAAAPTPWPTVEWPTSPPEQQGMSSQALADLVDFGAANAMDSLLVVRHGHVVAEAYYAPFRPGLRHVVNSVTKAVVGTLTGIALKDGAVGPLDQSVIDLFPERKIANIDANKKAITLASLLDSTSGLDWREPLSNAPPETMLQMERSPDWVGFVLDRPMAQAPGLAFEYNSGTWHLLSAVLAMKTGRNTADYARQKLFAPLGITDVTWRQDPQAISIGGYGLFMHPRDMAKIGYLYLHGGQWDGQQLLPAAFVDRVNQATVDMRLGTTPSFRYASGWWTVPDKRAYMAVGFLRQLIIVLPDVDMVVVTTGRRHYPLVAFIDRITGAARSESPLPADAVASARLAERIKEAATEKPSEVGPISPLAKAVSGKPYRFGPNTFGLKSLVVDLVSPKPFYEALFDRSRVGMADLRVGGPLGLEGLFRVDDGGRDGPLRAAKGRWLSETRFQLVSRSLSEGFVTTATMEFRGDQVDVEIEDNHGARGRLQGHSTHSTN